jgi:cysteine desulfurase
MRAEVQQLLFESLPKPWANAASLHRPGHQARMALEQARETIASLLGAQVEEIVFTSGATEANNLALFGWMRQQPTGSHFLVSAIEHPSIWEAAQQLQQEGYCLEVIPWGEDPLQWIRPETALLSMMAVNNEVGHIHSLPERKGNWKLHVDAVQSGCLGWPNLDGIDFLSLSAHKLGGPVGSGALYVKQGLRLQPLLIGGAQEDYRRAGTSNVLAAKGLALAMQVTVQKRAEEAARLYRLRSQLQQLERIPGAISLCPEGSPHISSWLFEGVVAEPLLVLLDLQGIAASSGSACSSHSLEPSRVVQAMGYSPEMSRGLIRFSLGHSTQESEIVRLLELLPGLVEQVRSARCRPV